MLLFWRQDMFDIHLTMAQTHLDNSCSDSMIRKYYNLHSNLQNQQLLNPIYFDLLLQQSLRLLQERIKFAS